MQSRTTTWTVTRFRETLRAIDPRVVLVTPRVARRLARAQLAEQPLGVHVPHADCVVMPLAAALEHATAAELSIDDGLSANESLIVLAQPDTGWLESESDEAILLCAWRRLLHGSVHAVLDRARSEGRLTDRDIHDRVQRLGSVAFDEIASVLRQDERVPHPCDETVVCLEFLSTYIELRYLAPHELADTFPGLSDLDSIDRDIGEIVDAALLLDQSRPPGAVALVANDHSFREFDELDAEGDSIDPPADLARAASSTSEPAFAMLCRRARFILRRGNAVRAAILWTHAARLTTPEQADLVRALARDALAQLSLRLQCALGCDNAEHARWQAALESLREPAVLGLRTSAARVLYDIQRVCVDFERPLHKIELVEWLLSLGRRSIKRPLPNQREILLIRHLRRGVKRLGRTRCGDQERRHLAGLLHHAIDRAEAVLRDKFRPLVKRAMQRADFRAASIPEKVALDAITDELIDRVETRGFLTIGEVRDAVARQAIKLPDLTLHEFIHGDRLLHADRRLAVALDGVYRRAEIYLRGLQKGSSLFFGTALGRTLTLWLLLPFGGTFFLLEGLQHLAEPVVAFLERGVARGTLPNTHTEPIAHTTVPQFANLYSVTILGLIVLCLLHSSAFRAICMRFLRIVGWGVRGLSWDFPRWVVALPPVALILASPFLKWLRRWVLGPLVPALFVLVAMRAVGAAPLATAVGCLAAYGVSAASLNSRWGLLVKEEIADGISYAWNHVQFNLLPGLYRAVMGFFHAIVERLDAALYAVDEWLRFRAGESRFMLAAKSILGAAWRVIAYVARFCVNLLIEPQVNPIKHFPVVTVAHKITLPFMLALPAVLVSPPFGLSLVTANGLAFTLQMLLPGVFGFLVWELKENWRLYAANRPGVLVPTVVGSHGETVVRLLRRGFHSGTVPRIFARLRRADHATRQRTRQRGQHKQREALRHVSVDLRHFAERELIALLDKSHTLADLGLSVRRVRLSTNRIELAMERSRYTGDALVVRFDEHGGWLAASVGGVPAWVADLDPAARISLANALAGFFQKAGADLIHERIRAALGTSWERYELSNRGLRVWLAEQPESPLVFDLREGTVVAEARAASATPELPGEPTLIVQQILLRQNAITWSAWVDAWEREHAGEPTPNLAGFTLTATAPRVEV